MLGKGLQLKTTTLVVFFMWLAGLEELHARPCSCTQKVFDVHEKTCPYSISFTVSRHIVSSLTLPVVREEYIEYHY